MNSHLARLRAAAVCAAACAVSPAIANDLQISGSPQIFVTAGASYAFQPQGISVGPLPTHFTIQNSPAWAIFNPFTGSLTGNPGTTDAGTYLGVTISISDGQSSVALPSFSISVQVPGAPVTPVLSWQAPTQNDDGSQLTDLAGYYVYQGSTPQSMVPIAVMGAYSSNLALSALGPGTYYFAVTALNLAGEQSTMSAVVSYSVD
jgi:hypothetical protein